MITTPAIAFLTHTHGFAAGIVISASHNPWQDNGIKLFGPDGYKLPDAVELAIEEEIFRQLAGSRLTPPQQTVPPAVNEADRAEYVRFLLAAVPGLSLDGRRIVIDCANGAASSVAPQLFADLGRQKSSSPTPAPTAATSMKTAERLHPDIVAAEVKHQRASMGITFDGDADRAFFADEDGRVVNGDAVLLLAARDLQARGLLTNSTVVATTMSNMGLEAAFKRSGIQMLRAAVGDKYVLEQMIATGAALGGEQSGHIIFSGRSTTGDGLLTALAAARHCPPERKVSGRARRRPQGLSPGHRQRKSPREETARRDSHRCRGYSQPPRRSWPTPAASSSATPAPKPWPAS